MNLIKGIPYFDDFKKLQNMPSELIDYTILSFTGTNKFLRPYIENEIETGGAENSFIPELVFIESKTVQKGIYHFKKYYFKEKYLELFIDRYKNNTLFLFKDFEFFTN